MNATESGNYSAKLDGTEDKLSKFCHYDGKSYEIQLISTVLKPIVHQLKGVPIVHPLKGVPIVHPLYIYIYIFKNCKSVQISSAF